MARSWFDDAPGVREAGVSPDASEPRGGYSVGRAARDRDVVVVPLSVVDDSLEAVLTSRVRPGPLVYARPDGGVNVDPGWAIGGLLLEDRLEPEAIVAGPPAPSWRIQHRTAATRQLYRTQYSGEMDAAALLRRPVHWLEALVGGMISLDAVASEILVTDFNLHSIVTHPVVGRGEQRLTVSGCLGWRMWRFLDPEVAGIVSAALRIAEFSAVGSLVTYGYGQVQCEPTAGRRSHGQD